MELTIDNYENTYSLVEMDFLCIDKLTSDKKPFICNYYNKHQLNSQNFPSTKDIGDILDIKRVIYRINNNIYVNFDSIQTADCKTFKSIFINVNIHKNKEYNYTQLTNTITEIMETLQ
jgi:hypothetical protein